MLAFIILIIVGIVLIHIGIINIKGDINSIHSYHRYRVTENDKSIYGKMMGIGTILCGFSIVIFGLLFFIGELFKQSILITIGSYLTIIVLIVGVGTMIYATLKYNKGIF